MPNYQNNMRGYGRRVVETQPAPPNICCGVRNDVLDVLPIAMAYVPWQDWKCLYDIDKGFQRGTIFEELDKPFLGRGGCSK